MTAAQYPEPTPAERRAWYFEKRDRRARAAYRNSLPTGLHALYALLADAPSPWHAEVIEARIETVREHNRARNARTRRNFAARSSAQVARVLAEHFPDGRQTCKGCGRHLPLSSFAVRPTKHVPVAGHCNDCVSAHAEVGLGE